MRFAAVVPAGGERRCDCLVDVAQYFRRTGRQVVVQQHHARIEITDADAAASTHDRLEDQCVTGRQLEARRLAHAGHQRADAHAHAGLAQDFFERRDVLQVMDVAGVVLGNQQHAARVGAYALDGRLDRLNAQGQRIRIEIVESAEKQIRIDGGQLEAGVSQVDRRIKRNGALLSLRPEPALDVRHPVEKRTLEILERSSERSLETRDHEPIVNQPGRPKKRAPRSAR